MTDLFWAALFFLLGIYSPDKIQQTAKGIVRNAYDTVARKISGEGPPPSTIDKDGASEPYKAPVTSEATTPPGPENKMARDSVPETAKEGQSRE